MKITPNFLTGIIGDPVSHSLSPSLHNNWYAEQNLPYVYLPFLVAPKDLSQFVTHLKTQDIGKILSFANVANLSDINPLLISLKGISVTIPHKEACLAYLDNISPAAQKIGAVNTIIYQNKKLYGENTDWLGWLAAFKQTSQIDLSSQSLSTLIIGSGGTARAIAYALQSSGQKDITLYSRNIAKAHSLSKEFQLEPLTTLPTTANKFQLLINTTPLGLSPKDQSPIPFSLFTPNTIVSDLTYSKTPNKLEKDCLKAKALYFDGKAMLIEQAKLQHKLYVA